MKTKSEVKKHLSLLCILCAVMLLLSGCDGSGVPIRQTTPVVLPTPSLSYVAPIGDATLEYTGTAMLYLQRRGSTRLISVADDVAFSAARLDAESVIRALLEYPGSGTALSMGNGVKLSLYGANPVEVSGDVATVNLAATALQLDRKNLYICTQAIANTLTEFSRIRYVNLLVMDKQIGLDLGSTLPTGALTRSMQDDAGAAYEQALSQRVQTDENPGDRLLTTTVTLYFPLSAVNGVMSEARNITFSSQTPESMIERILQELSKGPAAVTGSPVLALLSELLNSPPIVTEPEGSAGKLIELHFDATLDDMLTAMGVSRASCMASLCDTLTTFLPNVTGLNIYIGDEKVDHLMLGATDGIIFDDGIMRRADFSALLLDLGTLYFADAQDQTLVEVKRPLLFYQRTQPRALLLELFKGPSAADTIQGLHPVAGIGQLSDADVLGLSLNGNTLLVNLSQRFLTVGKNITRQQDRLLAYAIVNTLLADGRARSVAFFVGGKTPSDFTGEIAWQGLFYPNWEKVDIQ